MTERQQGIVKWFDNAKGYGFIVSPDGQDVFVHYRVIAGEGYRSLSEGQRVEYVAVPLTAVAEKLRARTAGSHRGIA